MRTSMSAGSRGLRPSGSKGTLLMSPGPALSLAGGGAGMQAPATAAKWTDPARLASFFDQDWARASYGPKAGTPALGPYVSLDLERPRSVMDTSVPVETATISGVSFHSGQEDGSGQLSISRSAPDLSESGRGLRSNMTALASMKSTVKTIPSLPHPASETLSRIPETDEQLGTHEATEELKLRRAKRDTGSTVVFRDSRFLFGFCSQAKAEIINSIPTPTDQLGRLSTAEERRRELFLNKRIKQAENLMRKAQGQRQRRTNLMEKKYKYLLENGNDPRFVPSKEFSNTLKKQRMRERKIQRSRSLRSIQLDRLNTTQTRRGFDFVRDFRSESQAPLAQHEQKLFPSKARCAQSHQDTWSRLYIRDVKPINHARRQNLYNKEVGCKPHNIITGAKLLIQPTEPPPKRRRDAHPSIVVHGMQQFGGGR